MSPAASNWSWSMTEPYRVLFICTGNCCRSQMAEALLRHMGGGRFVASSAGSNPAGYIHPLAAATMQDMGVAMDGQYSKSWDAAAEEPHDIIITVCDSAASQPCPTFPGHPVVAHWSLPDPSFLPGTEEERLQAAAGVAGTLHRWLQRLIDLPLETLTTKELRAELRRIAES
jgi:arsenate reductase (thioredoxin)